MTVYELNIDGLVGPTHHYAGLSYGNKASMQHANEISNPRHAALEGLKKIKLLHELGLKQAVLPPHPRPHFAFLNALGFTGDKAEILKQAKAENPLALSAAFSASSMWSANAATVSPSADTTDNRVHFTAANLTHHLHRHQEALVSAALLRQIFAHEKYFAHHAPLPSTYALSDEGAANHNRFANTHGTKGLQLFVYGRDASHHNTPLHFPARQTLMASQAIAKLHLLDPKQVIFAKQNPKAIEAGVFHNDVISLANESVFLVHEDAFTEQAALLKALQASVDFKLNIIEVPRERVSLTDAVHSYLFNAQLITLPNTQSMTLIAPSECEHLASTARFIEDLIQDNQNPIASVHYVNVKQSMQNGGGPACLRLRVPLTETELHNMHQGVLITDALIEKLENIIEHYYRTSLSFEDLSDLSFIDEVKLAYDAIYQALNLERLAIEQL